MGHGEKVKQVVTQLRVGKNRAWAKNPNGEKSMSLRGVS